jgi:hypothetical protein
MLKTSEYNKNMVHCKKGSQFSRPQTLPWPEKILIIPGQREFVISNIPAGGRENRANLFLQCTLFPARASLVSNIPAGGRETRVKLFYGVHYSRPVRVL